MTTRHAPPTAPRRHVEAPDGLTALPPTVDDVRRHVAALMAAGWRLTDIAAASGVSESTVKHVRAGLPKQFHPYTLARLAGVEVTPRARQTVPTGSVPAGPVHDHVAALRAAGLTWAQVAAAAGVSPRTVESLRPNQTYVRAEFADKVLTVPIPSRCTLPPGHVPSADTLAILDRLVDTGHVLRRVADRVGAPTRLLVDVHVRRPHTVPERVAAAARALADGCCDDTLLVDVDLSRRHLTVLLNGGASLRRVAAAADVSPFVLRQVRDGTRTSVTRSFERAVLAVSAHDAARPAPAAPATRGRVPVDAARDHVAGLARRGVSWAAMARASGLRETTLRSVAAGTWRTVDPRIAVAVLTIPRDLPPRDTRRVRLDAQARVAWWADRGVTQQQVADATGLPRSQVERVARSAPVLDAVADTLLTVDPDTLLPDRPARVPLPVVRDHVTALLSRPTTVKAVAVAAGVDKATVARIAAGSGGPVSRRVADALLAVAAVDTTGAAVDAAPVRAHLDRLMSAEMTPADVARVSGVGADVVQRLRSGVTRRVTVDTAEWLLAVTGPVPSRTPWGDLDAVRAHVAGLHDSGLAWAAIAHDAGVASSTVASWAPGASRPARRVRADVAARVLAVAPCAQRSGLVNADTARDVIRGLVDAGIPRYAVAAALHVSPATVTAVLTGRRAQVTGRVHGAAVALSRDDAARHVTGMVDATGTYRRWTALRAAGWTVPALQARTTTPLTALDRIERRRRVSAATAAAVHDLWDLLRDVPGPSQAAATRARARGWLPPAWWDDATIDTIGGYPRDALPPSLITARRARARTMATRGLSATLIAQALRVPVDIVSEDCDC